MDEKPIKERQPKKVGREPVATKDNVKEAIEFLEGKNLTLSGRKVIDMVGGSSTTVNKLIDEIRPERKKAMADRDLPDYMYKSLAQYVKEKTSELRHAHLVEKNEWKQQQRVSIALMDAMSQTKTDGESAKEALRGNLDGLKGRLEQETSAHALTRGDLKSAQDQIVTYKLSIQKLEQKLMDAEDRFISVRAGRDKLLDQCADQIKAIEEQRERVITSEKELVDQRGMNAELTGQLRSEKEAHEQTKQKLEATQAQLMTKTQACTKAESEHEQSLKEAQHYQSLAEVLTRQLKESQKEGGECREKLARTEGQLEREITRRES